jgi:hypothetical protein
MPANDVPARVLSLEVRSMRNVGALTRQAVADWHYWVDQGYEL